MGKGKRTVIKGYDPLEEAASPGYKKVTNVGKKRKVVKEKYTSEDGVKRKLKTVYKGREGRWIVEPNKVVKKTLTIKGKGMKRSKENLLNN